MTFQREVLALNNVERYQVTTFCAMIKTNLKRQTIILDNGRTRENPIGTDRLVVYANYYNSTR